MEEKNNNTGLVVLVTVLVMLVLGLVGFIVYEKVINKTNEANTEENNKVEIEDTNQEKYKNLTTEDKEKYNKETGNLEFYFHTIYNYGLKVGYGVNILSTIQEKLNFTWYMSIRDEKINIKQVAGGETGDNMIFLSDVINKYEELFNEKITEKDILNNSNYEIKNGYVYGSNITGYDKDFTLKIKSHSINSKNNTHTLTFDFLTYKDDKNNYEVEEYLKYIESDILDYPKKLVYAQVKIELEQIGGNYIFKSIVFEK